MAINNEGLQAIGKTQEGEFTCLCKDPIPPIGTYVFTTEYTFKDKSWGYIGIACENYDLETGMTDKGVWALSSDGYLHLNEECALKPVCDPLGSGAKVRVEVNRQKEYVAFYVDERVVAS